MNRPKPKEGSLFGCCSHLPVGGPEKGGDLTCIIVTVIRPDEPSVWLTLCPECVVRMTAEGSAGVRSVGLPLLGRPEPIPRAKAEVLAAEIGHQPVLAFYMPRRPRPGAH